MSVLRYSGGGSDELKSGIAVTLNQLRYFVHVVEMGSIKRAAGFLSLAQSALSQQIRLLEGELAVQLLHRNGRGVVPTEAGMQLLHHARTVLGDVEAAVADLAGFSDTPRGKVTLGVTPTITQILAVPLISSLRATHPLIVLKIMEGFSGHVLEWLSMGRVDVGVLYDAPRTKQFDTRELLLEDLDLVGPAGADTGDGEVELKAVAGLPLILPSSPHGLRILIDTIAAQNALTLRIELELDALQPIKSLVESGMGWTILPLPAVHLEVATGRLSARRIIRPGIKRQVMLATASNRPVSPTMRVLIASIRSEVRRQIGLMGSAV